MLKVCFIQSQYKDYLYDWRCECGNCTHGIRTLCCTHLLFCSNKRNNWIIVFTTCKDLVKLKRNGKFRN